MKKLLFIALSAILLSALFISGCAEPEEPTPEPTPSPEPAPEPEPAPGGPEYGGTLKCISGAIPNNLGYAPDKAPSDNYLMLPVIEHLAEWGDTKGTLVGVLAESWDVDPANLTFTWHLRKGVKFHDGTPWNAEACRWNFQLGLDTGRLSAGQFIDSLEVVDENTLKMHLNSYDWTMPEYWGLMSPISPTSYESAGATDEERIEWARANAVGTGAFTVSEWVRDDHITFVKNPDYWQEGLPYLDAIEIRFIPDAMVASAAMEAGEADMWFSVAQVQNIIDLQGKDLKMVWGPGMFNLILLDSSTPDSYFADKKIREAVEYALDRPTIADMLGQGLYEPLHQMASSTWPGYVEGYDPRPYNPDKARELLAEAGYPDGFKTTLMITEMGTDAGAAIKAYLGEVGIDVELDVADLGRYFGSVFGTGYTDMVLSASGINPSGTDLYVHFGPDPMTFRTGNIYKSPEYLALCTAALDTKYLTAAEAMPTVKEAIRQGGEDAMIIPLWRTCEAGIMQTYVHSDYPIIHAIIWTPQDDWMEAH
ncbi:MAG: ABC transporter substrate-binding protein [Dehalococcoidales bacterium]|nr:ABC transporter substrate-binding protein [Dehalococcoidales bacterium]